MSVVTRFPPSPTGFMHIGNARTALFNYLYARRHGGKFVVRIEDTDRKRHNEDAVEAIINALDWMGLDHDGEITSQFANQARHAEIAQQLLDNGKAYKCYCSPEELEAMRETAKAEGHKTLYNRKWRDANPADAPAGVAPVVRIKAPLKHEGDGETVIDDQVQGKVTVSNDQLDDFIILRSDGSPTYMLSVVVDDHDMGVTHVMRGDDHLNNTFRQHIINTAMEWDSPVYGHLPLIHGPDGGKFSKRHGAQSIEEYRDMGYLPEALCNYLLRLGWGHGDDEIIPRAQAIEWFGFDGIGKAAANFDFAKLESINAHYINEADPAALIESARPFFKTHQDLDLDDTAVERMTAGIDELKSRAKTLIDFANDAAFYARALPFAYNEKAQGLIADGQDVLSVLAQRFTDMPDFTGDAIKDMCKTVADEVAGGKMGKVGMPLRAAITGTTASPTIFDACAILGRDESVARLKAALS
jgi:glutamyl-tRNA synthetase